MHRRLPTGCARVRHTVRLIFARPMILSHAWLCDLLPESLGVDELSHILTAVGLEVEGTEPVGAAAGPAAGLVAAEVMSLSRHPNADKLQVATIDAGGGFVQKVVCGAPNIAVGQKVIYAAPGTVLSVGGAERQIGQATIRGVESAGMLCSAAEAGISSDTSGLYLLSPAAAPGTPVGKIFPAPATAAPDTVLHIGITPNRASGMSHVGAARDVTAYLAHHRGEGRPLRIPDANLTVPGTLPFSVSVESAEACPLYTGLLLEGVRVGPSPGWMQARLEAVGVRPINNVVDATNYALYELGQPLHAFNADAVQGGIRVKTLPDGTPFTTLDGVARTLRATDLMICDGQDVPLCMAGVFGGQSSGVGEETTRVFLESAIFNATSVRRTAVHHGLRTDASIRFEKGVDHRTTEVALRRAAALILEHGGGSVAAGITRVESPAHLESRPIRVAFNRIAAVCGQEYQPSKVRAILQSLGYTAEPDGPEALVVQVPPHLREVMEPVHIAGEVLRINGLDAVPVPPRLSIPAARPRTTDRSLRAVAAEALSGMGFTEILTNSLQSSKLYGVDVPVVRLLNSLSTELDVMRPQMLHSGLEVVAYNTARRTTDCLFFEAGTVYAPGGKQSEYKEHSCLSIWTTGNARPAAWMAKARAADFYFVKGVVAALFQRLRVRHVPVEASEGRVVWHAGAGLLGSAEQVAPSVAKVWGIKQPVVYADLDWSAIVAAARGAAPVAFAELSRTPAVQRDLALLLPASTAYSAVEEATRAASPPALTGAALFDVYTGAELGEGQRSLAIRYTFDGGGRTLTDAEIDGWMQAFVAQYEAMGAVVRSGVEK